MAINTAHTQYLNHAFKIPQESPDYPQKSQLVIESIQRVMHDAMHRGENKIIINTNLEFGIPMENVNKIAGPFIEAWAYETFLKVLRQNNNAFALTNVTPGSRLNLADVILQFNVGNGSIITAHVDAKATSKDIEGSGKSPNITSFNRIRNAYLEDPNFIFVILSIKHRVTSKKDFHSGMMMGIMEVLDVHVYDLKYLSDTDISYNPALGSGQLQVRDIHYVALKPRTTWEFLQLLDQKFIASNKGYTAWYGLAQKGNWITK